MATATAVRTATFQLANRTVTITPADLDGIRSVSADAIHASDRTDRDQLASELTVATADIDQSGIPRVGRWILEARDGNLALVRHPARGPVMHFILVQLRRDAGRWSATGIDDERVTAR